MSRVLGDIYLVVVRYWPLFLAMQMMDSGTRLIYEAFRFELASVPPALVFIPFFALNPSLSLGAIARLAKVKPSERDAKRFAELAAKAGTSDVCLVYIDRAPGIFDTPACYHQGKIVVWKHWRDRYSDEQADYILAHELAHHVLHRSLLLKLGRFIGLPLGCFGIGIATSALIAGLSSSQNALAQASVAVIVTLLLACLLFGGSYRLTPLRKDMEYEADAFAVRLTGDKSGAESALRTFVENIGKRKVNTRTHPGIEDRINRMNALDLSTSPLEA